MRNARACLLGFMIFGATAVIGSPTYAASDPFIGEIMMIGANFCPRGWANADGQLLAVNQNQALFSLLGTMYGGDGRTTFGLPDLRGRVPLHTGTGPGLTPRNQGSKEGEEQHTLTESELPSPKTSSNAPASGNWQHAESGKAWTVQGRIPDPRKRGPALRPRIPNTQSVSPPGTPHNVMQPYLTVRFCIALQGTYPSRN